ncbi:MAG: hypothetical protein LQ338_000233 [Usnochroma carphineum]|nr:MAG: hypothetical protein LQ338_000233 [Usnochroma carphineum]
MFKPSEEKKDFRCPRCAAQWTQLEVLDSVSPTGLFICHRCGGQLERDEPTAGETSGSEKQVKLAAQLERVLKLLQGIDDATIPKNDFETALSLQIPVQRNRDVNPVRSTVPLEASRGPPAAVKGINQPTVQDLTVDLTSSAEKTAAEKFAEENRKIAIAAQNALPVWHTQSTVTAGAEPSTKRDPILGNGRQTADIKIEQAGEGEKTSVTAVADDSDELAAYYARMAQEKEKEEREDREAEESSDEEDEEEFEDVSINPTPSSSQSNPRERESGNLKPLPNAMAQGKDLVSESGSSPPGSVASTPGIALESNGPLAKRVKVEEANGGTVFSRAVSDEDEEAEFEDAL